MGVSSVFYHLTFKVFKDINIFIISYTGGEKKLSKEEKIVNFLKAIANSVRIEIIKQLMKGKKCVTEINKLCESSQPNISQHLTILRLNNIVECRREGNFKCYLLKKPEEMKKLFEILTKIV